MCVTISIKSTSEVTATNAAAPRRHRPAPATTTAAPEQQDVWVATLASLRQDDMVLGRERWEGTQRIRQYDTVR